jgi:hypothetical protein
MRSSRISKNEIGVSKLAAASMIPAFDSSDHRPKVGKAKYSAQNATGPHRKIWRSSTRLLLFGLAISEGESETEIGLYKVFY